MQSVKQVACPRCGIKVAFTPANKWRPFCSERCKLIDLGKWAAEDYRVPDEKGSEQISENEPEQSDDR